MVQIIPEKRNRSTGEMFSEAFSNVGNTIGNGIGQYLQGQQAQQLRKSQQDETARFIEEVTGRRVTGREDPELLKALAVQASKNQGKKDLWADKQDFISNTFPQGFGQQVRGETNPQMNEGQTISSQENEPVLYTSEQILRTAAVDPNLSRAMQHHNDTILREKSDQKNLNEKKREELRKETLPKRTELANKAEIAQKGIESKQQLLNLIRSGNLNDPTYAAIMDNLPFNLGQRMLSPETVEYRAGLVDNYADLKTLFAGATRVKEIEILEKKIADVYLTDEQKQRVLESRIEAHKADLIMAEAAEELEAEGKAVGVLGFDKEVRKKAKPKLEALAKKVIDDQAAIIKDAENRKGIALNPKDPDDRQIAEQIMKEAGGNRTKARELAKKKGYIF